MTVQGEERRLTVHNVHEYAKWLFLIECYSFMCPMRGGPPIIGRIGPIGPIGPMGPIGPIGPPIGPIGPIGGRIPEADKHIESHAYIRIHFVAMLQTYSDTLLRFIKLDLFPMNKIALHHKGHCAWHHELMNAQLHMLQNMYVKLHQNWISSLCKVSE